MTLDPDISALLADINRLAPSSAGDPLTEELVPLRRVLGTRVAGEFCGIDILHITEILKLSPVTYVPGAPRHILGVTSLRGQIIPVVTMRLLLGHAPESGPAGPAAAATLRPRIVVVHSNDLVAGLLVDSVTEVYDLLTPLEPPVGPASGAHPIREGYVIHNGDMLVILHIPNLFSRLTEARA